MNPDPWNLERFVKAQNAIFEQVCAELRSGRKRTHWMWFIFPQIRGLGSSDIAQYYAIASKQETVAYLDHPVLGPRLRECTQLVLNIPDRTIDDIFGYPDNLKFHSSMTLFAHATVDNAVFLEALQKYFSDAFDQPTLDRI